MLVLGCLLWLLPAAEAQFLGKSAEDWLRLLKTDGDPRHRRNAAFALGKMGNGAGAVLYQLQTCLAGEKDAKVREAIVFALGEIAPGSLGFNNDTALVDLLCQIVRSKDEQPLVRRSAAYALGCLASPAPRAQAALAEALTDAEPAVRQNAAWALVVQYPREERAKAVPVLKQALHDTDDLVRRDAAEALLKVPDGDSVRVLLPDLLPLCESKSAEVRRSAVKVVAIIADPEDKAAAPVLGELLKDRDPEIQVNAALALSKIGGKEAAAAMPVLVGLLQDPDAEQRGRAAAGLGGLGTGAAGAIPQLLKVLRDDKDEEVRSLSAQALQDIGDTGNEVVGALVERVRSGRESLKVRERCATALAAVAKKSPERGLQVLPPMLAVLQDPGDEPKVRLRVVWFLNSYFANLDLRDIAKVPGAFDALAGVLKEPRDARNAVLRYGCAYLLSAWKEKAPDTVLDTIAEMLKNPDLSLFDRNTTSAGVTGSETAGVRATSRETFKGDARVMATNALSLLGKERWAGRKEITDQLRALAANAMTDPTLRKEAQELVKMLQ